MQSTRARLVLVLSLCVTLAACGEGTGPGSGGPMTKGAWATQRLVAKVTADSAPLLGTSGDDALVLAVSEEVTIQSHLSIDGEPYEPGEPLGTGLGHVQLAGVVPLPDGGWLTLGSGGLVERNGDSELAFEPVAFRSVDGLVWERVEVAGFDQPVDVNDLAVFEGTIVAAGSYRTADDPAMGGFEAHVWTSTDGTSFSEIDLPGVPSPNGHDDESYAGHLAATGGRLMAAGQLDGSASLWTSDDQARTWRRTADPALDAAYAVTGLAAVGDVVVAGIGDGAVTALRSIDRGATWTPVDALPVGGEEAGWAPVWGDEHRFWTLTGIDDTTWSRPEACYADLEQCGHAPDPRVVVSTDGTAWTGVDLPGEPEAISSTADGRVVVLATDARGFAVHTLPAGGSPPHARPTPEPETVDLVTLEEGDQAEVGVRYHAPMYVHCGMDWFWFGDATWRRTDDGRDVETGAGDGAPDDWPLAGQVLYGHATRTDADHLEYAVGDEVVATYRRATGAPGCD